MTFSRYLLLSLFTMVGASSLTGAENLPTSSERYSDLESMPEVSFRRHVLPLASRMGCSSRECHGSFQGAGDFQLSLFGYDFAKDHKAMHEGDDPRIDKSNPEQSLILLKPTLQVKHRGKKRMEKDSWEYNVFLSWIRNGSLNDEKETGSFDRLELRPASIEFQSSGDNIPLQVFAHWDDGTIEEVTGLTRFQSNDESVATIDKNGVVTSVGPGDTHVVAFYDNGVHPIPVIRPWNERIANNYPEVPISTEIDRLVVQKLAQLGIVPSDVCSDEDFLRRIKADLTGTLPTAEEAITFIQDPSPNKRVALIETLLQSDAYAAWWTTKLCDFTGNNQFQMPDRNFRTEFSEQWWEWIHHRIKNNVSYNKIVAGIVLATSRSNQKQKFSDFATEMSSYFKKSEPKPFEQRETMPHYWARRNIRTSEEKALSFSHSFLGVRIECAQCHKHPFDQWTKQDFDHFKAFFEPVRYGRNPIKPNNKNEMTYASLAREIEEASGYDKTKRTNRKELDNEIKRRASEGKPVAWLEVFIDPRYQQAKTKKSNPRSRQKNKRVLTPKILGGDEVMVTTFNDPREPLMDWMEDPENPYFARSFVNRVWAHYFNRGLVEPADDLNLANPPVNEPLMRHLEKGFILSGFDMKWLHREILMSDTYQRSWKPNDSNRLDDKNFSHMVLRRLPAEVVYDGIKQATAPDIIHHAHLDIDKRAIGSSSGLIARNARAGSSYSLNVFGKPKRETNCDCERNNDPTLLQTIFTRNDPDMLQSIESRSKRDPRWIDELRQKYGSTSSGSNTKFARNQLTRIQEQLKSLQKKKPQPPEEDSGLAESKYKAAMKLYREEVKVLKNRQVRLQNMINDAPAPSKKVSRKGNVKKERVPVERLVSETFLRALGRPPYDQEFQMAIIDVHKSDDPIDGIKELLWALLNTKEFMINH